MSKFNFAKTSFLAGELSPTALGNSDSPQFKAGCRTLYNAYSLVTGGATNRPGTRYCVTPDSGFASTIPFATSDGNYFIVEFSSNKIRIYNTDGTLQTITSDGGSTSATSQYHLTDSTLLTDLNWVQSGDTIWVFSGKAVPKKITYGIWSGAAFGYHPFDYGLTGDTLAAAYPYLAANTSAVTLAPSATTGNVVITCSSGIFGSFGGDPNQYVGGIIRMTHAGTTGYARITSRGSGFQVTATTCVDFGGTGAITDWAFSAIGPINTHSGWPTCGEFFGDRLLFAGMAGKPDTIVASKTSDYNTFRRPSAGATDSDATSVTLNARRVSRIKWMCAKDRLAVGTASEEITIDSLSAGSSAFGVAYRTSHGSLGVKPQKAFDTLLFVDQSGRRVREFIYSYETTSYVSDDVSFWADHMSGKTAGVPADIVSTAWDATRQILWCVDDSGGLFGMTRDRKGGIAAWHRHELGGSGGNGDDGPIVRSVSCLPSGDGYDIIVLSVTRTTAAGTLHTVELVHDDFRFDNINDASAIAARSCVYLDCAKVSNSGSAVSSVSGLSHLNGETVAIVGDGYYLGTATVTAGAVTFPQSQTATQCVVGLPYRSIIEPVPIDAGSMLGSAQGRPKRISQIVMKFFRTLGAKFGRDEDHLEEINFRDDSMAMNAVIPFFTGDKIRAFSAFPDTEASVMVVQDLPYPMTLCSITVRGDTSD